jgi:hypothetical protein
MGPILCPETSVNNYHTTPCTYPEDHIFHGKQVFSISQNKMCESTYIATLNVSNHSEEQRNHAMYCNVTQLSVTVTFILPPLSHQSDTISLEENALRRFNVANNNQTYLVLHVKCPIFLPDFNQIWIFSTDFHESRPYQISEIYVQWELL